MTGRYVHVRRAGPEDWELWRDLRLRSLRDDPDAFGSTLEREQDLTSEDWRSRLSGHLGPAFLALHHREPVGLAGGITSVDGSGEMMIVAMWVHPVRRGLGTGRRLLDAAVTWAQGNGLAAYLWVSEGNAAARSLYESYGFVATGETDRLRPGSPETVHRMVLL